MAGPLEGIKVLEVGGGPGAFCTVMLADMGADVLTIETVPGTRSGVFRQLSGQALLRHKKRRAASFENRNKRNMALNLRTEEGQRILHKLVETADVIEEGFRPGVMQRLGGDYETLSKINPRIVYCSLSGYGQDGPYKNLPGHDLNYISFGGAVEIIGEVGRKPVIPLNLLADYASAALHGVIGILFALFARERTGRGQYVDISYLDGVVNLMGATMLAFNYFYDGSLFKRGEGPLSGGDAYPRYHIYETKDGKYISLGGAEQHFWERVCQALGREDFISMGAREPGEPDAKAREATSQLQQIFLTKTRDEWFEFLAPYDVCVSKVLSWDEVVEDPQVRYRQMVVDIDDPEVGKVRQVGIAIKLSETPGSIRSLGPILGQHTDEVLRALGYDAKAIAGLRQQGAVA